MPAARAAQLRLPPQRRVSLCSLARGTHASAESRRQHEWLKTALRNTLRAVGQTPPCAHCATLSLCEPPHKATPCGWLTAHGAETPPPLPCYQQAEKTPPCALRYQRSPCTAPSYKPRCLASRYGLLAATKAK